MKNYAKLLFLFVVTLIGQYSHAHGGGNYDHSDFLKGMRPGDKAALVMVHFGTTHQDTREKTIDALNTKVQQKFSELDFHEAYTSRIIIKRLGERGIHKQNPLQVLQSLKEKGYTHILLQPTKIINGVEMESLYRNVRSMQDEFKDVRVGTPLLYEPEDYSKLIDILTVNIKSDRAYLFVGHGTYDPTTAQYAMVDYMFKAKGLKNCMVGTIEGYPTFEDAVNQIKALKTKNVTLVPLMFVAGDHAKNDIAGEWKEELEGEGFKVTVDLQGLGENYKVQDLYIDHIEFMLHHKKRDILDKKAVYEVTGEVMD